MDPIEQLGGENSGVKISDTSAKFFRGAGLVVYKDDDEINSVMYGKSDEQVRTYLQLMFVDKDVTVKGVTPAGSAFDLTLKKGWNKTYLTQGMGMAENTSTEPEGLKWEFMGE
jgi:hypothetical protein